MAKEAAKSTRSSGLVMRSTDGAKYEGETALCPKPKRVDMIDTTYDNA